MKKQLVLRNNTLVVTTGVTSEHNLIVRIPPLAVPYLPTIK